jgi:hypothetical protein
MLTGSLNFVRDKNQKYNTEFKLYPKTQKTPLFIQTPVEKFEQFTWISEYSSPTDYTLKRIRQSGNVVGMLEGTAFQVNLRAVDPTNLFSITDDSNLTYIWKRDGAVLYEYSSQNNLRGTSLLQITSESCTRDISGLYELEASNRFGTTTSEPITIDVVNHKYHPYLYKNLLINGSGEQGTSEWTTDSDIAVKTLSSQNRNQASIPQQLYEVTYTSPYPDDFYFSSYGNETTLAEWFNKTQDASQFNFAQNELGQYNKWIIKNFHPCLVPTDGAIQNGVRVTGPQDSFFPSWDYIDTYNKNGLLYTLGNIVNKTKTYITRDKIKFSIFGGKAKSIAYQDIQVSDISGMIDGEYYGIDKLVAHFFAYVGIGISGYKLEYEDANTGAMVEENTIPVSLYNYKVGSLTDKPALIPLLPNATQYTNAIGSYNDGSRDKFAVKIKKGSKIKLTPVTYDKTDIRLDFLSINGEFISSETIQGPTEKDIWAVKEKFFIPYYIGNLYGWCTDASDQEFYFYSQSYTTIDAIRGVDDPNKQVKDTHAEWVQKYHYGLIDNEWEVARRNSDIKLITKKPSDREIKEEAVERYGFNRSFIEQYGETRIPLWYIDGLIGSRYDRGAAAFFGIQKNVVVPRGTRSIRVNIIFNHTSEALYDSNPRVKNWNKQTLYYDYFTGGQAGDKLTEYGNPRCGVTATHLSLHPDVVQISEDYNTYEVNLTGSVWFQELQRLNVPNEYNSIQPTSYDLSNLAYKYSVSTIPQIQSLNNIPSPISVADIAVLYGQTNPYTLNTGSGIPIPDPIPEQPQGTQFSGIEVSGSAEVPVTESEED